MTQEHGDRLLNAVADLAREEHAQLFDQDLGDAAFAELSEEELQALAGAVSGQLSRAPSAMAEQQRPPAARRNGARWLGWLAAAAALFGGWWLAAQLPSREGQLGDVQVASADRRLSLPDGSTLALAEQTEARVVRLDPREVRVQLERGSVECEVAHNPERRFVVAVGTLEVAVRGTHFTVSYGLSATSPEQIVVSVERGLVEVRQPPDRMLALLGPGQRWSSEGREPVPSEPVPSEPAPAVPAPEAIVSAPARAAAAHTRSAPSARELFERADAERVAGRARQAAASFDELRRRYPTDPRAGYAAFMLGRIRLDSLADPSGAAEAFQFAIAHPGSGYFLEDAAARRVEALARTGQAGECRKARESFLREYPQAARAPVVAQLCDR